MGGLTLAWLLPAVLLSAADPAPVVVRAKLPKGGAVSVRLVFRKGVQVDGAALPKAFLAERAQGWVAYDALTPAGKRWALEALWPEDVWRKDEVLHKVRHPELESIWLMAALFHGRGQAYDLLQEANPKLPEKLRKGDVWRIPRTVISRELGGLGRAQVERAQPEDELDDEARVGAYRALLTYGSDEKGRYAAYRLRKGEALYSSVVMRYTDRVDPKDVHELAQDLAKRAGIEDVRAIPAGTEIRIPVEHLAAPFQVEGAPALVEEREVREEVRRTTRLDAGPRLQGVTVVLDAGHGGIDIGAKANGVWESDFVYDIVMRVRRLLEDGTEARIASTIRYPGVGFKARETIKSPVREAQILTDPPFDNDGESPNAVSVHLRWVLANDIVAGHGLKGDARKTVFLSFHADSLHPSARGTMVYVPGASGVPATFALGAGRLPKVAEAARGAKVAFSGKERIQGEARSRLLAEALVKALHKEDLPVHANRPIRNVIRRGKKSFVPAVIRYSAASAKMLVEVCNLQNEGDAEQLRDPDYRERYALAVVKALRSYFGK